MHVQQNWMQCSISAKVWKKSINTNKYLKLPVFGVVGTIKILQGGEMASDNVLGSSDDPLLSTGKLVVRKPSLAILPPTRMASCYQWRASPQNMKG